MVTTRILWRNVVPAGIEPVAEDVGGLWDRGPEDGDLAVVIDADQPGYTDVQQAGVPGDGQVREPAFDMVADLAGMPAARAVEVEGHRVAVQVGDVPGVGGVVDRQPQLDGAADRVRYEVRDRGRGDGRVRHGSCGGKVEIRHLHLVTAGSFYVCSHAAPTMGVYMLW
jgi:hypothetical protein